MKSPKTKAPKPMKARRMWANQCEYGGIIYAYPTRTEAYYQGSDDDLHRNTPVAVIPLHDMERVLLDALYAWGKHDGDAEGSMKAALAAIGVLPKKRKAKVDTGTDRGLWRTIRLARKGRK